MAEVVRMHDGKRFLCAVLGEPGRKYTPYVSFGYPIRKRRIANGRVERDCKTLMKGKKPYPLTRACNNLLRMGKHGNITKGARRFLQEVKA